MKERVCQIVALVLMVGLPLTSLANNPPNSDNHGACSATGSGGGTGNNSVHLNLPLGKLKRNSAAQSAALVIEQHQPSPLLPTPQALHVSVGNYAILSAATLPDNSKKWTVLRNNGELLYFTMEPTSTTGYVPGGDEFIHNQPNEYWLYVGNGDYYVFDDSSLDVKKVFINGITQELPDMDITIVRDANDVLEQVKGPGRLYDIVVESSYKYRIDVYRFDANVMSWNPTTKRYDIDNGVEDMESWTVEAPNPSNLNEINITQQNGETSRVYEYSYNPFTDAWAMTADDWVTVETVSQTYNSAYTVKYITKTVVKDGALNYKHTTIRALDKDWGEPIVGEHSYSAANDVLTTTYEYYEDPTGNGYTKKKSMRRLDGYWEIYVYDGEGRLLRKIEPWLDDQYHETYIYNSQNTDPYNIGKVTDYFYNPNAPGVGYHYTPSEYADKHDEPRTVTVRIRGVVVEKTMYAYPDQAYISVRPEVEQQCLSAGAVFDDSSNLVTIKKYYTTSVDSSHPLYKERPRSIIYPDGTADYYSYAAADYTGSLNPTEDPDGWIFSPFPTGGDAWAERVSRHVYDDQYDYLYFDDDLYMNIPHKALVTEKVWDEYGNEVLNDTKVVNSTYFDPYNDDWNYNSPLDLVERKVMGYDDLGNVEREIYSDGTEETGSWGSGCCGKDNGTDRYGITTSYLYDEYKRLESMTRNGITTTYELDGKGRRLSTTQTGGGLSLTSSKTYDWRGRVETATDESGLVTSTVYDNDARTTTTTYPGGGTRIVKKYRDGRIQSITGTAQVAEYYTYGVNSDGSTWTRIDTAYAADDTSILEADRRWVKTTYDMVSRIKKIEKPGYNGSTLLTENYYNNKGQLEKRVSGVSGGDTQTWLYEYDELGTLKRIGLDVDDVGGADLLNVASMDRITDYETVYEDVGGTWHKKETTTIYPDDNSGTAQILSIQKTQLTGLGGVDTSGTYDGKLISKTVTTDVYSKDTVHYTYVNLDDEGTSGVDEQKVTQVIDIPTSSQDAIVIIEGGLKTSETSTTGVETTFDYDSLGRLYTETILSDADLNGADERTVSTEYAYYSSEIGEKGRLQSITQVIAGSDDNTVTYTYDSITGKLHEETKQATLADSNPQTVTTTYSYYDTTRKLKKVEGSQYPVEYGYDEYGQLNSLKTWQDDSVSAGFVETTWGYDPATGLLENKRYDNAGDTGVGPDYEYFEDGKLKSRTWVRKTGDNPGDPSIKTDYAYHDTGELKKISYNDGTHAVYLGAESGSSTTYLNRQGLPTKIEDEQGTRSLSFTISSELDDESIASVYALSRDFDSYGRPAGYDLTTATPGQDIVYGYDSRGRFGSVYYSIDGKSDTFTYSWVDGADLLKGYSTAGATPAASIEYGYEINRDLKTEVVNESLGANVSTFEYVYDEIGRRKTRDDTFESQPAIANQFLYNARSEVTDADMDGTSGFEDVYDFDDIGNRITSALDGGSTITYARNDLNQYTGLSGGATATLTYDEDGNLENDGIWTYEWNGENRLKAMEKINKVDGSERLEFKYDFMGRRYQKDVYVWATGSFPATPDTTSTFIYDGWNLIHESFAASSRSYVWGLDLSQTLQGAGGVAGLLCSIHKPDGGNSAVYYSMADANGNISDYVDASGNVTAHFEYDAFGQIVNAPATQGPMPNAFQFRYSSKYQDAETDLNYYGYRYYTPEVGRWLNRDPIDEIGGINLYASNGNDSFNNNDYMGLIVACDCYDFEIVEAIVTFWTATRTYIPASGEHRIIQGDKRIDGIFYNVIFDEDRCECLEYSGKNVQVDYVSNIGRDEDLAARDKHQHTTRLTYGFTGDGSTVPHPPGWNIEMWEMSGFERVRYGDKIEWNWSIEGTECGSGTYLVF